MPIECKQLEDLLETWKTTSKFNESKFGFELYVKKRLKEIIDNLSLDDITVSEDVSPSRTHGKLMLIKTVHVLPKSRL